MAEQKKPLDATVLYGSLEFLRGFADHCHHGKEEKLLFPLLASRNPVLETGPVKVLTGEHEAGRHFLQELEASLPGVEAGDAQATKEAVRNLDLYTRMLRRHIEKEEGVLFPLARTMVTSEDNDRLATGFEEVEEEMGSGVHERFESLLRDLEARTRVL